MQEDRRFGKDKKLAMNKKPSEFCKLQDLVDNFDVECQ